MSTDESPVLTRRVLGRAGAAAVAVGAVAAVLPTQEASAASSQDSYWTYGPYRLVDSRTGVGGYTGPIHSGQTRVFDLSAIFVPSIGDLVCNITVVNTYKRGFLTFWGTGTRPATSDINWFGSNQVLANTIHVTTAVNAGGDPVFTYYCGGSGARTDVIVDIKGYFYNPAGAPRKTQSKSPGQR
jgi:hypothetical protein